MKYQSYLFNSEGKKLTRKQRHGGGSRANMNIVYEHNKALHSRRNKRRHQLEVE